MSAPELAADISGTIEAADLLDARLCSPMCLLAREPGRICICRCRGEFHGALVAALVPSRRIASVSYTEPWHELYAPELLDELVPEVARSADRYPRIRAAADAREPFAYIRKWKRATWYLHCEDTVGGRGLTRDAERLILTLIDALTLANRVRLADASRYRADAEGVKTRSEAQALGVLVRELITGNDSGTRRAIDVLHSRGFDPKALGA